MLRQPATLLCLAFITGLLASWQLGLPAASWPAVLLTIGAAAAAGGVAARFVPQRWLAGPDGRIWVAVGLAGAVAIAYLQLRVPRPAASDVSHLVAGSTGSVPTYIRGTVRTIPSTGANNRVRFWLQAEGANNAQSVSGNLYVTAPLLQGTGIYPGQTIAIAGKLYKPQAPSSPGAFDFRRYLRRQGAFAGMTAQNIEIFTAPPTWGWWRLRERIVKAQVRWLGSPEGQLVGSIALGRRAVDLPADIRELFIRAGLAHILSASGFHVSLLLGAIGTLTQRLGSGTRLGIGLGGLALYVGLTGISPSVARAAIMGAAALFALHSNRRVDPVGALLLAATALLLINPLWIADLGFQLSFLATLGLLATVPAVSAWLTWLPGPIAGAIAVPLAVFPWVLPVQLATFGVFPPYSIAVNVLTVPTVVAISLGGMASALAAAVYPPAGSAITWLLGPLVRATVAIVSWFDGLPGSSLAVGRIAMWQLLLLYGLILMVWGWPRLQRRWLPVAVLGILTIAGPLAHQRLTSARVTVFASGRDPIVVARDRAATLLINSGSAKTARYRLVPYLQQTGVARLDAALAFSPRPQTGWPSVARSSAIAKFYPYPPLELPPATLAGLGRDPEPPVARLQVGNMQVTRPPQEPPWLELHLRDRRWLILGPLPPDTDDLPLPTASEKSTILIWSGQPLPSPWLAAVAPEIAIATGQRVSTPTEAQLQGQGTGLYRLGGNGTIIWQQQGTRTWLQVGTERARLH